MTSLQLSNYHVEGTTKEAHISPKIAATVKEDTPWGRGIYTQLV